MRWSAPTSPGWKPSATATPSCARAGRCRGSATAGAGPGWPSTCGQLKVLPARFEEEVRRQVPEVGDRREYHDSNPRFTVLKVSYYEGGGKDHGAEDTTRDHG